MKKIIVILFLFIYPTNSIAHIGHYIKYNKIEMEIFRNGELIGYNHYFFNRNGSETIVTNQIKFVVKLLGATVFQVEGYSEEKYFKDQLVSYNSKTLQNDKKKFVNLTFDQKNKKFDIILARAVSQLNHLLSISYNICKKNTTLLLHKGVHIEEEIVQATKCWDFTHVLHENEREKGSFILELKNIIKSI